MAGAEEGAKWVVAFLGFIEGKPVLNIVSIKKHKKEASKNQQEKFMRCCFPKNPFSIGIMLGTISGAKAVWEEKRLKAILNS